MGRQRTNRLISFFHVAQPNGMLIKDGSLLGESKVLAEPRPSRSMLSFCSSGGEMETVGGEIRQCTQLPLRASLVRIETSAMCVIDS